MTTARVSGHDFELDYAGVQAAVVDIDPEPIQEHYVRAGPFAGWCRGRSGAGAEIRKTPCVPRLSRQLCTHAYPTGETAFHDAIPGKKSRLE